MKHQIHEERLKVPTVHGGHLFVRQLSPNHPQGVVVLVHGLGNRGDVFLHEGHGLANYLSEMGFVCLVPDLIGHGQSWPKRSRKLTHDAEAIIQEDFPRLAAEARRVAQGKPIFLVGQGFGGVLLAGAYAHSAALRPDVAGMIHLGVRRSLETARFSPWRRWFWQRGLEWLGRLKGEVPLHWLRHSLDAESLPLYRDFLRWSDGSWTSADGALDYSERANATEWPPSLYLARRNGGYIDHPSDTRAFMRELGSHNARLLLLAKGGGNLRNYSVLSMLQHDDAWVDHFPVILDWMAERVRQMTPEDKVRYLRSV